MLAYSLISETSFCFPISRRNNTDAQATGELCKVISLASWSHSIIISFPSMSLLRDDRNGYPSICVLKMIFSLLSVNVHGYIQLLCRGISSARQFSAMNFYNETSLTAVWPKVTFGIYGYFLNKVICMIAFSFYWGWGEDIRIFWLFIPSKLPFQLSFSQGH